MNLYLEFQGCILLHLEGNNTGRKSKTDITVSDNPIFINEYEIQHFG